ncbi:MAG: hypothetical protein KDD47_11585 [Acidobacteria bacterium]|nr:hypothetical protein [Acidobacteriota bacterium]
MRRSPRLGWVAALLALLLLTVMAAIASRKTAGPSVLSSGADGWLAARRYLEARGLETRVENRPLTADRPEKVWVTAFPWQQPPPDLRLLPLREFVRRGGTLFLGYSGQRKAGKESQVFSQLDAPLVEAGPEPPLSPLAWWRAESQEWSLLPESQDSTRKGRVSVLGTVPQAPKAARVLYRLEEGGRPVAFSFEVGQGRIVLFPSEALSNSRLAAPGNADLLEALIALVPTAPWTFDEFAHGLEPPRQRQASDSPRIAFDLFVGHLALLYVLALAAWMRRFGPPWQDPPIKAGSAATFLRGLGSLHHRLGHHRRAAELLQERTRALYPRRPVPNQAAALAEKGDARSLVRLARLLGGSEIELDISSSPDGPPEKGTS